MMYVKRTTAQICLTFFELSQFLKNKILKSSIELNSQYRVIKLYMKKKGPKKTRFFFRCLFGPNRHTF